MDGVLRTIVTQKLGWSAGWEDQMRRLRQNKSTPGQVAGNGLIDRRLLLLGGAALAAGTHAEAEPLRVEPYMRIPGAGFAAYGQPSSHEGKVARIFASAPGTTGTGASRTPLHLLDGMITPLIHGLVRRPLTFSLDALARYPMESRITFLECAGNGQLLNQKEPVQTGAQALQGLVSCAEWTGVRLAVLLQEAGVDPKAQWILAEGADAAGMSRSVPLAKAMDDALIALYQNGERVRPANGYPMRLLLPGYEGNQNVKWLRRIKVTEGPTMTKDETSKYTLLGADGKALQFVFPMEAKSLITRPSPGLAMQGAGLYEISGLAWSGYGRIAKVEVSADGGKSFAPAALQEPVLSKALTRFRIPWRWDGGPAVLQSRATDASGYVQPTRAELIARRSPNGIYHFNGMTSWSVAQNGEIKHVYA